MILRGHDVCIAIDFTNLPQEILGRDEIGVADWTTNVADGLFTMESSISTLEWLPIIFF